MIDPRKLEYFTMAAWLRGYSEGIEKQDLNTPAVQKKLLKAADMLDYVFNSYINNGDEDECASV